MHTFKPNVGDPFILVNPRQCKNEKNVKGIAEFHHGFSLLSQQYNYNCTYKCM